MLVPVVLVTGLGSAEDRIQGIEAGADDFPEQAGKEKSSWRACARWCASSASRTTRKTRRQCCQPGGAASKRRTPYRRPLRPVVAYTVSLGEKIGLSEEQRIACAAAGIVHDVG